MSPDDPRPEGVVSLIERLRAASPHLALRRARVFIIDDQAVGRQVLKELVRKFDRELEVLTFHGGEEALAAVGEGPPDLVLTDYQMPGMDGIAFTRAFRRLPGCEDVPVVVITVAEARRVRYQALEAGATDFLTRPVDHHECVARCRNLLLLRDQQLALRRRASLLEERVVGRAGPATLATGGETEAPALAGRAERRLAGPPAGALELDRVAMALRPLLAETVRFFCPQADARGLEIVAQIAPGVPERVWGDERYLRYLLVNLVGDATEFAPEGTLRVAVQTVARDPREVRLRFQVSISLTEETAEPEEVHCPQVLRRRQADRGPDLGLCERLVTLLGGRYGRQCGARARTTWFTLTLGLETRVLLVTGEALAARLGSWLSGWGLPWDRAGGVADAFHWMVRRSAAGEPYRFVLVEPAVLALPVEAFSTTLADDRTLGGATPLLVTSEGDEASAERARRAGYAAVLAEPLDRAALFNVLAGGLERGAEAVPALARLPRALRRRVLVAAEAPSARARLVRALEGAGHRVEALADREAILDRLADTDVDLLVVDHDGEVDRLLAALRLFGAGPPPVVALTDTPPPSGPDPAQDEVIWLARSVSDEALREAVARVLAPERP